MPSNRNYRRAAGIERALRTGEALFRTGQRTAGFYEVIAGNVRLVRIDRAGREAVLHVAAAGDTLGEASLFASTYHCDAIATIDAVVRLYPKAAVPQSSASLHSYACTPSDEAARSR